MHCSPESLFRGRPVRFPGCRNPAAQTQRPDIRLTASNEEEQLRLELGQVLRYAYQLRGSEETVPVLIVERRPGPRVSAAPSHDPRGHGTLPLNDRRFQRILKLANERLRQP